MTTFPFPAAPLSMIRIKDYDTMILRGPNEDDPDPVMCICETCKGEGTEPDGVLDCEDCDGTGEVEMEFEEPDHDDSAREPWE